ncbi:hypothetical protein XNC1_1427 [Xenorhabdus nematophila ATCC 19061]|uniref:Uncharacterized protein n=1 Tax=Xenorhabdus nematophila (strain ATCC 19061 / DSM 3370 / CCUG 14189 / LMG 1036 / NCIMB 9965 / AN6) TaxID=406817 RepID=D3VAQ4_XENNA|nr:hypothetical protein XNC1_1427 [Xenorhabdus nematophila ATCC 19061]
MGKWSSTANPPNAVASHNNAGIAAINSAHPCDGVLTTGLRVNKVGRQHNKMNGNSALSKLKYIEKGALSGPVCTLSRYLRLWKPGM